VHRTASKPTPDLAWEWSGAALGALYALPAAVVVLAEGSGEGLALAVGVLPAAIIGLVPRRRARLVVLLLGALIGISMLIGGLLAGTPVLAVVSIALLGPGVALLAARSPFGQIAMFLALPMVGVGLSYSNAAEAAGLAALMVAGSAYACAVSMLFPERERAQRERALPPTLGYGIRLGAAGATAAAIGFLLDLEHVGWATAAALLVMRPVPEMQRLRSVGRLLAVALGAVAAVLLVDLEPGAAVFALAAVATIAGAAATRRSRWYVTPAFTTFLVFLLLLDPTGGDTTTRFSERFLETLLGVGLAYLFGLALPRLLSERR
jgi:Fusaric acid resistance protein family